MGWNTVSKSLSGELDPNQCTNFIRNVNGTDSAELNQSPYNGSSTYFDRLSFQVQIKRDKRHSLQPN